MEIDGASNNGVEAVRQLKETITYLPTGPYKIYIIDEVHMLSVNAFNALLKTLEEPPSHALFIMATTEMRKIPATVLSRAQILQFHQIADHLIYEQLKKICEQEKTQADSSALWMLVRESQGSLRDAQGLLDQLITFCHNKFEVQDVSDILGLTDRSLLMQTVKNLLEKSPDQILKVLDQLQTKGGDPSLFLQSLIKEMRNLLLLNRPAADSLKNLIPLSEQEKTQLKEWSQTLSSEDLHLLLDMALKGSWEINRVQDSKVFLEMLLLKMSEAPYIESLFEKKPIQVEDNEEPETRSSGEDQSLVKDTKDTDVVNLKGRQALQGIPDQVRNDGGEVRNSESPSRAFSLSRSDKKVRSDKEVLSDKGQVKNDEQRVKNDKEKKNSAQSLFEQTQKMSEQIKSSTFNPKEKHKDVQEHLFIQQIQSLFKADILDSKDK